MLHISFWFMLMLIRWDEADMLQRKKQKLC